MFKIILSHLRQSVNIILKSVSHSHFLSPVSAYLSVSLAGSCSLLKIHALQHGIPSISAFKAQNCALQRFLLCESRFHSYVVFYLLLRRREKVELTRSLFRYL